MRESKQSVFLSLVGVVVVGGCLVVAFDLHQARTTPAHSLDSHSPDSRRGASATQIVISGVHSLEFHSPDSHSPEAHSPESHLVNRIVVPEVPALPPAESPPRTAEPSEHKAAPGPIRATGKFAELTASCRREAEHFEPVTDERAHAAREELRVRLNDFYRLLAKDPAATAAWPEFLHWTETLQLLDASAADDAADRIQCRWQAGASTWTAPELAAVAEALGRHVAMLRARTAHESAEQHAAAWNQLADLISESPDDQAGLNRIAEAVVARERLGDGPQLTAAIRQSLSGPDMTLRASAGWLQSRFSAVDEPFQVQGVYSGMSTSTSGRLTGVVTCQLGRSPDAARWTLLFNGASAAATTANGNGASVNSRANTNLMARQVYRLGATGLAAEPSVAGGATALVYDQINAGGGRRRQQVANDTVQASRATAERDTATGASHALAQRMDSVGADAVARFNESYFANVRDPFTRADQMPPVVEFHSDESLISGDWRWPQSPTFAKRQPEFHSPTGLTLAVDAAAIERFMAANIGGKRMSEERLGQMTALSTPPPDDSDKTSDRWLRFAAEPCDVELADGRISFRFHVTEFESGGVRYPPMTAAAAYKCQFDGDHLALVREGGFRTQLVAADASSAVGASGRQQTLQVAVRRFFNRALAEHIIWPGPGSSSTGPPLPLSNLQVKAVLVADGWLQLGLSAADAAKK